MGFIRLVVLIIMLSACARGFTNSVSRPAFRLADVARAMSSAGSPDTSVVSICTEKITAALDATSVKVTGTYFLFYSCAWPSATFFSNKQCSSYWRGNQSPVSLFSFANDTGAYDDPNGSHISIEVVSAKFEGKRPMQRQQLVYKAIWAELQGPVHAVDSMVCKTPDEVWEIARYNVLF